MTDDLDRFLDLWLPLTATGTYRAFAWWAGGFGVDNQITFFPVAPHQSDDANSIRQLVEGKKEVFFYPSTFSQKSTRMEYAEPVPLLWLDLDECPPTGDNVDYPLPSIYWETSQGHHQALWFLAQVPKVEERIKMNRAAYEAHKEYGADPSYDASRRLRLPGTTNLKPGRGGWKISLTTANGGWYDVIELPQSEGIEITDPAPTKGKEHDIMVGTLRAGLPPQVISLLEERPAFGGRSDVLMTLLLKLARIEHLTDEDIFWLAAGAGSNKFLNRPAQLWREVHKARALVEPGPPGLRVMPPEPPLTGAAPSGTSEPPGPLAGWLRRGELPEDFTLKWQANPFLPQKSVLLVTGMPGTRKSWLVTDLAVCVAQGKPFCGSPIRDPGPVMYVAPDDERERLSERVYLCEKAHGCTEPTEFWWRQTGVHFMDKKWAVKLQAAIEVIKPKLVVFDGIYLMGYNPQDFGSSLPQQLVPLKEMCSTYNISFVLVHHSAKSKKEDIADPRTAGMGATLLGAFFTTAWSLENVGLDKDGWQKVQWRIGGKGSPGRPIYKAAFGPDLEKYELKIQKGLWSEDEDVTVPKQSEY